MNSVNKPTNNVNRFPFVHPITLNKHHEIFTAYVGEYFDIGYTFMLKSTMGKSLRNECSCKYINSLNYSKFFKVYRIQC